MNLSKSNSRFRFHTVTRYIRVEVIELFDAALLGIFIRNLQLLSQYVCLPDLWFWANCQVVAVVYIESYLSSLFCIAALNSRIVAGDFKISHG
jgi:hypothetical protein